MRPLSSLSCRPLYDVHKTYAENIASGPFFEGYFQERMLPPKEQWRSFLGYPIASPLGVPAGPLLASRWVALASTLGFDVLTYKTIRSHSYPGHPLPNIVFVQQDPNDSTVVWQRQKAPEDLSKISITNSFGMPSMSREFLQQDIRAAKNSLKIGQVLIVSVAGSPGSIQEMSCDFATAGIIARDAGADIIEANFSCPNVSMQEGSLYCDPEASYEIAKYLAKTVFPLPLIIKVGLFLHEDQMKNTFQAFARAGVQGICGINTIPAKVLTSNGLPALGKTRETSGICGDLIRKPALAFVHAARKIIEREKLNLALAGCGGIMLPGHFNDFLTQGADIAMSATGMMWDPYLAAKWHHRKDNERHYSSTF